MADRQGHAAALRPYTGEWSSCDGHCCAEIRSTDPDGPWPAMVLVEIEAVNDSVGSWECAPDVLGDFRAMPFEDDSFQLVVFDPPHIVRAKQPPEGINGLKYGALHPATEQDDVRRGFAECWRVLAPGGTLVFKWAGALDRVEPHFPAAPTVGSRNAPRGSKGLGTRWFIFYKPLFCGACDNGLAWDPRAEGNVVPCRCVA